MPELPEIETVLRSIQSSVVTQRVVDVIIYQPQLRWPVPTNLKAALLGQNFQQLARRGKYLLFTTAKGTMLIHLGMSGKLLLLPQEHILARHEHVNIVLANNMALCFIDQRRFGAILWTEDDPYTHPLIKSIGPEPLSQDFSGAYLLQRAKNHRMPIKTFIMDNHVVAGVGNIYANEALFLANINPSRPANALSLDEHTILVVAIKEVLSAAIAKGGTTIKDFVSGDGGSGGFQAELKVYGRASQPCIVCGTILLGSRLGQRSTFHCPKCQH